MTERIGLLGAGTVGGGLLRLIRARSDLSITISGVLVRDAGRRRDDAVPRERVTTNAEQVVDNCDTIVELMGGTGLAGDLILRGLSAGKRVVTANKAVLAERWSELAPFAAAGKLYFEAAVMAGTPVIGPLAGALRGSRPLELHAILNGTCNYIITRLEAGIPFAEALAEAQAKGYAEADPTLDISGVDAAHKLTVLCRLAFDPELEWSKVRSNTAGITDLTPQLAREAVRGGSRIRLLGSIATDGDHWSARVRPVRLAADHPLAGPASSRNGLVFRGDPVGEVFIAGAGAGAGPTASAVLADLMAAVRGVPGPTPLPRVAPVPKAASSASLDAVG